MGSGKWSVRKQHRHISCTGVETHQTSEGVEERAQSANSICYTYLVPVAFLITGSVKQPEV